MKIVELTSDGKVTQKITVGYGLIPAATEHIRQQRKTLFELSMAMLKEVSDPSVAQGEIVRTIEEYRETQTPQDGYVRIWLTTPVGVQFAIHHGTRKGTKLTMDQALEILDETDESAYRTLVAAIDEICLGKDLLERKNKINDAFKSAEALRLDKILGNIAAGRPALQGVDQESPKVPTNDQSDTQSQSS